MSTILETLGNLQRLIRRPPALNGSQPVATHRLPLIRPVGKAEYIHLLSDEVEAMEMLKAALLVDLNYEHLKKPEETVWKFIEDCWMDQKTDQVSKFIDLNSREALDHHCFIPVENLMTTVPYEILNIQLLPIDDPRIPGGSFREQLKKPIGSVISVPVKGTNYGLMAERAKIAASRILRVMRIALREHNSIHDRQLRFQLGITYAFDENLSGWKVRDEMPFELEFSESLIPLIQDRPISRLQSIPTTDILKKADLALGWIERSALSVEPVEALLYLFFALESLLGKRDVKLKAHDLAFRQTMLSHIVEGSFTHPTGTVFLYEDIRSRAVHGEEVIEVNWKEVRNFARVVRGTLAQYLILAEREKFTKRSRLLKYLDENPERVKLVDWLLEANRDNWHEWIRENVAKAPIQDSSN